MLKHFSKKKNIDDFWRTPAENVKNKKKVELANELDNLIFVREQSK